MLELVVTLLCMGVGCNALTVEQIGRIFGSIVQIVIEASKLACDISMVIKSILSDLSIKNPRWRPFSEMAAIKCILLHQAGPTWPTSQLVGQHFKMLKSPLNVP